MVMVQFEKSSDLIYCVIPKARVFTSGTRDLPYAHS